MVLREALYFALSTSNMLPTSEHPIGQLKVRVVRVGVSVRAGAK